MEHFVIVHKETGIIMTEGRGVYNSHFSAVKARGYFIKDEHKDDYQIVRLSTDLLKVIMEIQKDSQQ